LLNAIYELAHTKLVRDGYMMLTGTEIEALASEQHVPDEIGRHVVRGLTQEWLLTTEGGDVFMADVELAMRHEMIDRREHWQQNIARRRVLAASREPYEQGLSAGLRFDQSRELEDLSPGTALGAARVLEHYGWATVHPYMGRNFRMVLLPAGYDLLRDEPALRERLPTNASEDEEAHSPVATDALHEVIRSCEELLREREWTDALNELLEGDRQARDGHWVDAIREYYRALESGLKYRLGELGETYAPTAALRDLSGQAARIGAIPVNYQATFSFADSIRSPRSHGTGGQVQQVDVGQAEALLMGNLTRTLLLYLGHRPK
jgi:hypothetical protein